MGDTDESVAESVAPVLFVGDEFELVDEGFDVDGGGGEVFEGAAVGLVVFVDGDPFDLSFGDLTDGNEGFDGGFVAEGDFGGVEDDPVACLDAGEGCAFAVADLQEVAGLAAIGVFLSGDGDPVFHVGVHYSMGASSTPRRVKPAFACLLILLALAA